MPVYRYFGRFIKNSVDLLKFREIWQHCATDWPVTAVSDSRDSKPQHSWGRSGTHVSASKTQLAASVTQFFCRVDEALAASKPLQVRIQVTDRLIFLQSVIPMWMSGVLKITVSTKFRVFPLTRQATNWNGDCAEMWHAALSQSMVEFLRQPQQWSVLRILRHYYRIQI